MIKSGGPNWSPSCHAAPLGNSIGSGRSVGSPSGAPARNQSSIMSICSSLKEASFLKL